MTDSEAKIFNILRRIPIKDMAVIVRKELGIQYLISDADKLLEKHGWDWDDYLDALGAVPLRD